MLRTVCHATVQVSVFVGCSLCCLGSLSLRRKSSINHTFIQCVHFDGTSYIDITGSLSLRRLFCGGELGGRLRWPTFALYVSLWVRSMQ